MIQGVSSFPAQTDYSSSQLVRSVVQATKREAGGTRAAETEASRSDQKNAAHATQAANELTPEEQRQIRQLESADRSVRAHEQAHLAVGGDLVRGGATFSYATGPDNKRYAVAGEVSIDASPGRTPEDTIPKAQHIRATALAPADPSPQDRSVAARASQMESDARREVATLQQQEVADGRGRNGARFYRGVENAGAPLSAAGLNVFA